MNKILVACTAIILLISCAEEKRVATNIYSYLPSGSSHLLQTPQLKEFLQTTENIPLFKNNPIIGDSVILKDLKALSEILPGPTLISFSSKKEKSSYLLIQNLNKQRFNRDTLQNFLTGSQEGASKQIKEYNLSGSTFYAAIEDGILLAGNSSEVIERSLEKRTPLEEQDKSLQLVLTAADKNSNTIFINHQSPLTNPLSTVSSPFTSPADWSAYEIETEQGIVRVNGLAVSSPESGKILDVFENVGVEKNMAAHITPSSAKGFLSFTYSNVEEFSNNLRTYNKDSLVLPSTHLLRFTNEAGYINTGDKPALFFRTTDPQLAQDAFNTPPGKIKDFRGIEIFKDSVQSNAFDVLAPLINENEMEYFAFLENFLVFTETAEQLETIISNFLNKTTLGEQDQYKIAVPNLAESSSLLLVKTNKNEIFQEQENGSGSLNLENYSMTAVQYVREKDFSHVHGVISSGKETGDDEVKRSWKINLNNEAGTNPFMVKNHDTGQQEVLIQDVNNMLYLYSKSGDLLWQKQLEGRILGNVRQVDLFKNGNLQLAFSTPYSVQVLDRNGNTVAPFPLDFKDAITQPLAIFDYDNNRDYRFIVTQGTEVLMYDSRGRQVKGFNFNGTSSEIIDEPKHIRTRNKDYILIPEANQKLNIISRQGRSRVAVKEKINFSNNSWYLHQGEFVSLTIEGELVKVDEQGNVEKEKIATEGTPALAANQDLLVILSENILKVNGKDLTLDYGLYTNPEIRTLDGKNYIVLTDLQAQRVYIFDEEGNLLPEMPVYGSSLPQMGVENSSLLFTVKGEADNVLIYSIN